MRKLSIVVSKKGGGLQEVNKMLMIMLSMVVQTVLANKEIFT